jgi:hypothetical protein
MKGDCGTTREISTLFELFRDELAAQQLPTHLLSAHAEAGDGATAAAGSKAGLTNSCQAHEPKPRLVRLRTD